MTGDWGVQLLALAPDAIDGQTASFLFIQDLLQVRMTEVNRSGTKKCKLKPQIIRLKRINDNIDTFLTYLRGFFVRIIYMSVRQTEYRSPLNR